MWRMLRLWHSNFFVLTELDDLKRTAEAYDRNASLFVIGNMHITNPEAKIKAGKAAHNIYTDDPMVNDMGALIRVSHRWLANIFNNWKT